MATNRDVLGMAVASRTRRKRPCSICGRWFAPDPRVGGRQKCCSNPDCQKQRRARTQTAWRRRNPDYMRAYRLESKGAHRVHSCESGNNHLLGFGTGTLRGMGWVKGRIDGQAVRKTRAKQ